MRILYVGDIWEGGTARHRSDALSDLGHSVVRIDSTQPLDGPSGLANRALRKLGHMWDFIGVNRGVRDRLAEDQFDLLWVDRGVAIRPDTLRCARETHPSLRTVSYSPDDMVASHNRSPRYLASVRLYDLHVTTKSYNVQELRSLGAREVVFVDNAFAPRLHRPIELSDVDRHRYGADIAFVGHYEADRARQMFDLAHRGLTVTVWGPGWRRCRFSHARLRLRNRAVWGEEYAKVINATKVNLCFLRKANRDLQTTRSVEIPACGGFMLAERTDEHIRLFREGGEADFFSSVEELEDKCRYYLGHEEERRAIAAAGRRRCVGDGYSNQDRLRSVTASIAGLNLSKSAMHARPRN